MTYLLVVTYLLVASNVMQLDLVSDRTTDFISSKSSYFWLNCIMYGYVGTHEWNALFLEMRADK